MFCEKVIVMKDSKSGEIENKLAEIADMAQKIKSEQWGKKVNERGGIFLFFHYLGHGANIDSSTHIILNEPAS